eukprot:81177-Pleurochrysis_carterae.AAC.1
MDFNAKVSSGQVMAFNCRTTSVPLGATYSANSVYLASPVAKAALWQTRAIGISSGAPCLPGQKSVGRT